MLGGVTRGSPAVLLTLLAILAFAEGQDDCVKKRISLADFCKYDQRPEYVPKFYR